MNNFIYQNEHKRRHQIPLLRESEHSRLCQTYKHPDAFFTPQEERMLKLGDRPKA